MRLYRDTEFRHRLVNCPLDVDLDELKLKLFDNFLNTREWGARCKWSEELGQSIIFTLHSLRSSLQRLDGHCIEEVDFNESLIMDGSQQRIGDVIAAVYDVIDEIQGFGGTIVSKTMAILNPGLFVMWDKAIAKRYECKRNGEGYLAFLKRMKVLAERCLQSFSDVNQHGALVSYLAIKMRYDPPKTLAKYLDEYNWQTIVKGLTLPPKWHPFHSS